MLFVFNTRFEKFMINLRQFRIKYLKEYLPLNWIASNKIWNKSVIIKWIILTVGLAEELNTLLYNWRNNLSAIMLFDVLQCNTKLLSFYRRRRRVCDIAVRFGTLQ